jgi:hypothetical protein
MSGMHFIHSFLIGIPITLLVPLLAPFIPRHPAIFIVGLVFLALVFIFCFIVIASGKQPKRTLRIDWQAITMTDVTIFGTKERQMNAHGAALSAVRFDFFERLFTFDMYRTSSAYHIEVIGDGEIFLFPCDDEKEQSQIIKQIKEFLTQ